MASLRPWVSLLIGTGYNAFYYDSRSKGSLPTSGESFSKYGGNTTCFEIETEDSQIFIDAGTGFSSANIDGHKKKFTCFSLIYITIICRDYCSIRTFQSNQEIIVSSALMDGVILKRHLSKYFFTTIFSRRVFFLASIV